MRIEDDCEGRPTSFILMYDFVHRKRPNAFPKVAKLLQPLIRR